MSASLKKSWSGTLKLGFVTQPVAVYSTVDSKQAKVAFNQLHAECGGRINSQTVCRKCDEKAPLTTGEIRRGFEHAKGEYVQISDEELKTCQVENTKVIDLKEFVPVSELSPLMIAESAFVGPVQSEMSEAYVLIREALNGMAGIGTLCISNKEKLVAVVASGRGLILHTLRHASEVRDVLNVPVLDKLPTESDKATVKMMKTLMASMQSKTLDLEKYPNRYVENVQTLIRKKVEAKLSGQPIENTVPVVAMAKQGMDLAAMLKASIAAALDPTEKL